MLGTGTNSCYDAMARLLDENPRPDDVPAVCTLFEGTRADSSLTGSISGLTTHNFTPLHLIYGVMDGMADELNRMYTAYRQAGGTPKRLIGSGNGLRRTGICSSALSLLRLSAHAVRRPRGSCRRRGAVRRRAADLTAKKLSKSHIINILKYFAR